MKKVILGIFFMLIAVLQPFAQTKDTVITTYEPETVDVVIFKDKPEGFFGKILFGLTPSKKKFKVEQQHVFQQVLDTQTIEVQKKTVITDTEFKRQKSVRQIENALVSKAASRQSEDDWAKMRNIVHVEPNETTDSLTKMVYGFHPYWMGNAYKSYYFSLLSRVAYFSYEIDGSGNQINNYSNWETTEIFDYARKQGCKVDLTLSCFGNENTSAFLSNVNAQQKAIANIIATLKKRDGDGINLDFEQVSAAYATQYATFIRSLSAALKQENSNWFFSVCIPAIDWSGVYLINDIKDQVDLFIVMGYDFTGNQSKIAGANAPLSASEDGFDIDVSIQTWLKQGVAANKMVLGVPYYGNLWITESSIIPSNVKAYKGSKMYRDIVANYRDKYKSYFDSINSSAFMVYRENENWMQCWYDNEMSLNQKYNYIIANELAGAAIWALGYDNGYPALWHLLKQKFTIDPSLIENQIKKGEQKLIAKTSGDLNYYEHIDEKAPPIRILDIKPNESHPLSMFARVISMVVLILTFFGIVGFLIALLDYNVREVLFSDNFRVIIYFLLVFVLLQILLRLFDVLDDKDILFVGGIGIGIFMYFIVIKILKRNNRFKKDLTP